VISKIEHARIHTFSHSYVGVLPCPMAQTYLSSCTSIRQRTRTLSGMCIPNSTGPPDAISIEIVILWSRRFRAKLPSSSPFFGCNLNVVREIIRFYAVSWIKDVRRNSAMPTFSIGSNKRCISIQIKILRICHEELPHLTHSRRGGTWLCHLRRRGL